MLFVLPVQVRDGALRHQIPLANACLVLVNVLVFCFGWSHAWAVGPGTGVWTILGYGFAHASVLHLAGNMWTLLVFGNALNRRIGNSFYLLLYFSTIVALGIFVRLFCGSGLVGASGAIFAVIAACALLMPGRMVDLVYFALLPLTLLMGLFYRPEHWLGWFIRWGEFQVRAIWGLIFVPLLELWSLYWWGWNWTNLGHLFGMFCGVAAVLLMPSRLTVGRRASLEM